MDQSNRTYDILIIGGGAVGCAVARELSRSQRSVALVEKEADVAAGTSGRNSAVVHAGFNNRPGSLMARAWRESHFIPDIRSKGRKEGACRSLIRLESSWIWIAVTA